MGCAARRERWLSWMPFHPTARTVADEVTTKAKKAKLQTTTEKRLSFGSSKVEIYFRIQERPHSSMQLHLQGWASALANRPTQFSNDLKDVSSERPRQRNYSWLLLTFPPQKGQETHFTAWPSAATLEHLVVRCSISF